MTRLAVGVLIALVGFGELPQVVPTAHAVGTTAGFSVTAVAEFGVLGAQPQHLSSDRSAGISYFVINVGWAQWEPAQGQTSTVYSQQIRNQVVSIVNAGGIVGIDIGLQYPPGWVSTLSDGQLRDQFGNVAGLAPNYVFSHAVQNAMSDYIDSVVATLAPLVSQYRLGFGDTGEIMFPNPASSPNRTWWIGAAMTDLPPGTSPNPMPGWVPGTAVHNGTAVTPADAQAWYAWYVGALRRAVTTEANAFRSAGFTGVLALNIPGGGVGLSVYQYRINELLADPANAGPFGTMNTGTMFQTLIPDLRTTITGDLIVNATGAGDGTGSIGQIACQAGDENVGTSAGSTQAQSWSSTRWVNALAEKAGLPLEIENQNTNSSLDTVFALVASCDARYLGWLNDTSLHNGASPDVQLGTPTTPGTYAYAIAHS